MIEGDDMNRVNYSGEVVLDKRTKVALWTLVSVVVFVGIGIGTGSWRAFVTLQNIRDESSAGQAAIREKMAESEKQSSDARLALARLIQDSNASVAADIREMRQTQAAQQRAFDQRLIDLEREAGNRWSAPMMEVWVLQCQREGKWVDPTDIIDRYSR